MAQNLNDLLTFSSQYLFTAKVLPNKRRIAKKSLDTIIVAPLKKTCAVKPGYDIARAATGHSNTEIYSVSDIFVQKLSIFNY